MTEKDTKRTLMPMLIVFCIASIAMAQNNIYKHTSTKILPAKVTIQESKIIRPVTNQLLGFNDNWIHSNKMAMKPNQIGASGINPAFIKMLKGLPMPLNRMAGTDSQYFHWKWAVGPLAERKPQKLAKWLKPVKVQLGPLEWIDQTRRIDPNAKFDWVLNLRLERPARSAAELAQLFTAGKNNKWGKLRYDYGLKKPIHISIWELGNEMGHTWHWSVKRYIQTCRKVIKTVRKVVPDAKFAAMAAQSPWSKRWKGRDWRNWHRTVLKELGDKISYIVFHPYYDGLPIPKMYKYIDVIQNDIYHITGSHRIKIFLSEHARWPPIKHRNLWYETHSLGGCLATAEFLNLMFQSPQVAAACYHSLSAGPWGVIHKDKKTGKYWTTGIYDLFQLLNKSLGKTVVATKISGAQTDIAKNNLSFTATAMTTAQGLNLLLVNTSPTTARSIVFTTKKHYKIIKELILTAPSIHTHNSAGHDVLNVQSIDMNGKPLTHFTMPAKSIVVLECTFR